jgi:hypothetical protein
MLDNTYAGFKPAARVKMYVLRAELRVSKAELRVSKTELRVSKTKHRTNPVATSSCLVGVYPMECGRKRSKPKWIFQSTSDFTCRGCQFISTGIRSAK